MAEYQKLRVMVFLNPGLDPLGKGYNVNQAKIAVGSGGLFGKGLGHGTQSQLNFLPEQHTDFVFAVLAEELGLMGCLILVGLFGFLFFRLAVLARKIMDNFGAYLVIGSAIMLLFQTVLNIGVNIGVMPATGVPLPFVSYGGSSMLASMIIIGIVLNTSLRRDNLEKMKTFDR